MAQPPVEGKNEEREKAKLSHPDAFLDELDGDPNQDPDALLAQLAPNFEKEMNQLNADFADLKIDIETLDLDGVREEETPSSFKEKWQNFKKKWKNKSKDLADRAFYQLKYLFVWVVFEAPKKIAVYAKKIFIKLKSIYSIYAHWSKKRKILFFFSVISLSAISYGYFKLIKSQFLYRESFHFYGSMAELADHALTYDSEMGVEPFYNSPRVKAYSFQLKPVVVNLHRKDPNRDNPMAFFEFIFEGNSGDVVVEMKARESEFVDLVERVLETHTYESLDTYEGKSQLKENLRRELNKQLTEGIIRRVEIRNFFIKP